MKHFHYEAQVDSRSGFLPLGKYCIAAGNLVNNAAGKWDYNPTCLRNYSPSTGGIGFDGMIFTESGLKMGSSGCSMCPALQRRVSMSSICRRSWTESCSSGRQGRPESAQFARSFTAKHLMSLFVRLPQVLGHAQTVSLVSTPVTSLRLSMHLLA
jgi:hypothetical protein